MKFIDFNQEQPGKRITGKLTKKLGSGLFILTDNQDRKIKVAGEGYQVGETVAAISGQIVGRSRRSIVPQVFQV